MERKIGETFEYKGKTYKVVKVVQNSCIGCAFEGGCPHFSDNVGKDELEDCTSDSRTDGKNIIFVEVKPEQNAEEHKAREWVEGARHLIEGSNFDRILREMSALHKKKNADYGNAFADSFKEFGMITAVIRLNDKMNRLKSLTKQEAQVKGESIRDTLIDLACYAVMTIEELDKTKDNERKD